MRAFVAVDLPAPELPGAQHAVAAPTHLTLAFLGEVADDRRDALVASVGAGVRGEPFSVTLHGIGAFPSPARPRVVFVGCSDGAEALGRIAASVREALSGNGFSFDAKPFVPHLTVLRVRSPRDRERATALLQIPSTASFGRSLVTEVLLKESTLTREGAIHRIVARYPLGPRPG